MVVAKINVDGVCAVAEYRTHIPAGIIGARVQFDYAADPWDGLHKTVVFRGAVTKDVITDGEVVTIPAEVVANPNVALRVGVYGVDADGNIAIPTLWADLGNVRDAADPSGDPSTDPSLPVWTKLQAMIGDLDALDTVAKNNLVAAINEAMTKGGEIDEAEIQRIVEEYLAANPPKVTETDPTVPAWAKQPQKPTYTADEVHALPDTYTPPYQTAQQVGADPAGTAATAVSQHNTDTAAHNDLRVAVKELANRINATLDSDDTTLDQLSEIVTYIKSNKTLIDSITTSKVSVSDIVNDLVTNVADKPLSAAQGVALKGLIDELQALIPEAYTLPTATETTLGGVKPVTATDAMTQPVGVTEDGRLVTKPGEGGSGIAVTGATVGQTVRVAAVDDNGVPTAWEPVDLDGLEVIADVTLERNVGEVTISEDANGNPFELSKVIVELSSVKQNGGWSPAARELITFNGIGKDFFATNDAPYSFDSYQYCFPSKPDAVTTDTYTGYLFAKWELEIVENGIMLGKGRTGTIWQDADGVFYLGNGTKSKWVANKENSFTGEILTKDGINTVGLKFLYSSLPAGSHIVIKGIRM